MLTVNEYYYKFNMANYEDLFMPTRVVRPIIQILYRILDLNICSLFDSFTFKIFVLALI